MKPLTALLGRLSREGVSIAAEGDFLAVSPSDRVTAELRAAILPFRDDLLELLRLHGSGLLDLFRDSPPWPPASGRSGPVGADWLRAVGEPVRLRDGREGKLWAVSYDTRSGRLRLRVVFPNGWALLDPEDVLGLSAASLPKARPA